MFNVEKQLSEFRAQTVLCIGDLMLDDFVYGDVSRISPEAPAPVIAVQRSETTIGGAGNVARNLAALGVRCIFVGAIGDDHAGKVLSASLQRDSAKPRQANSAGAIAAGVALASGWPENGSVRGVTRSPTRADEALRSLQWIGAKIEPRRCVSATATLRVQLP